MGQALSGLQGGPLPVEPFAFNIANLALANVEALGDQLAGLGDGHLLVLGIHQGLEDLLTLRSGGCSSIFRWDITLSFAYPYQ